jgi:hypothetical protein
MKQLYCLKIHVKIFWVQKPWTMKLTSGWFQSFTAMHGQHFQEVKLYQNLCFNITLTAYKMKM